MADRFHVGTRKGLFTYTRSGAGWEAGPPAFLGEPVVGVLTDPRDGAIYASLRMGHFGPKMRRSRDGGESWEDIATPRFAAEPDLPPPQTPDDYMEIMETKKAYDGPSVDTVWILTPGGADEPGVIWAGTIPGGLFKSADHGESWSLVEPLWNMPEREKWMAGGAEGDGPGIHSVHVDPRDPKKLTLGVSTGGV